MRKSASDLIVPVQLLGEGEKLFSFRESADAFPALAEMEEQGEGMFLSPVEIRIALFRMDDLYRGEGTATTQVELQCGRCLERFVLPLEVECSLIFSRSCAGEDCPTAEERELAAEEIGLIPFAGEELDLRDAIQEQLLMALPVRPLCREDCRGLCPVCGVDLNRETCDCAQKLVNPQWGALAGLKIEEGKNQKR
jgi:uncharacterized protein